MIEGVVLSLVTALLWAISPLCFASVARRIGSFPVAVWRAVAAALILLVILVPYLVLVPMARAWPTWPQVGWMTLSGLLGMVLGDALSYEAFVLLGPRRTTQIMVLAPLFSVLGAWAFVGEGLQTHMLGGIAVVLVATAGAVFVGGKSQQNDPGEMSGKGVLFAVMGAAFMGLGAVAGRYVYAVGPLDVFVATVLRVGLSALILIVGLLVQGQFVQSLGRLRDRELLLRFVPGVLVGPFIGMVCYIAALKYTQAGIVSTLSSASPLFILPMVWYRYRTRIGFRVAIATLVAVAGVAMICWGK